MAFDHNIYPLIGAHATTSCDACHNGNYTNTPNTCDGCHLPDYNGSTNPNHTAAGFATDCATCHNETAWSPSSYDHAIYPLTNSHATVSCDQCHNGNYNNTPNTCDGCHMTDYNGAANPNHVTAGFPTDCAQCHDPTNWNNATFDHSGFPLLGAHATTSCDACHNGNYTNTPNTCHGCHLPDYNGSTNPNHTAAGFATDCATCHNETAWSPSSYDHAIYPLTNSHATVSCDQCHNGNYNNTPNTCDGCHMTDYNGAANPNHVTAGFPTDCAQCHDPTLWTNATFDHNIYPLLGVHATTSCDACHNGNYTNTPNTCDGCHLPDYNGSTNPNHTAAGFATDCATCHNETAWSPSSYDHAIYPLTNSHASVSCDQCHNSNYNNTPNTCDGCHMTEYNGATNPNHVTAGFPTDCATCHDPTNWNNATFDHSGFPLLGAHATTSCDACHNGNYTNTPNTCDGCHLPDYNASTNPNHTAAGFATYCATCHNETAWSPSSYDHAIYPLTNSHASVSCDQCHNGNYNNTPNTCDGCHMTDYNGAANPNHVTAGFPTDCAQCHDPTLWTNATFDHNIYPLLGVHATTSCDACHNGNYTNTPNTCDGCHLPDYNGSTNPNHTAAGFATDCATCHNETAWSPSSYDHAIYPLTNSHATVSCDQCHNGNYNNTPNTCDGCHMTDYNGAANPNHVTAGFPTDCATCHDPTNWNNATFDHSGFPLLGAHATTSCDACHNGNYTNTPNTCDGCHLPDYNASTNPNHTAAGFATDCATCHNETAWSPSSYDHAIYPLTNSHASVSCDQCHNGNYNNTPNTCDGCHMTDYNGAANPNHATAGFPTDCAQCHDPTLWTNATFDHSNYPLLGVHATTSCDACHNGNYTNTPNTCDGCHLPDYNGSTNPNHTAAGFATDCATCHNETAWSPSSYDHAIYPLTNSHATVSCDQCHNGNYNNTPNTCDGCHMTEYTGATNPNHVSAGFPTDCALCHDPTLWTNSSFDHNATNFPLTGSHLGPSCVTCHSNGYQGTPTNCDACHITEYNGTTNPNHVTAGFPTDCIVCHDVTNWVPATYDHNATNFPLVGAHVGVSCVSCHANGYTGTPTNCNACHMPDYNSANNPNHAADLFPTDCTLCHNENAWSPSSFNHDADYFRIYSGNHSSVWNTCATCHNVPGDFSIFTCIDCHNNQNQVNSNHSGVNGYSYNSVACYSCHGN
ncbi:MAG: hypothetical protein IPH00_02165 [Flavobacteriales bacterium]|nr:hypothetical protein [Flavobacteriales bacterium]